MKDNNERVIAQERELLALRKKLQQVTSRNALLETKIVTCEKHHLRDHNNYVAAMDDLASLQTDESAAISLLTKGILNEAPSVSIQDFATQLFSKCAVNGKAKLQTSKGRHITYKRVLVQYTTKADATPESRTRWLRKQADAMLKTCGTRGEIAVVAVLKALAKKNGLFIAERSKIELSVSQSSVLRDHIKTTSEFVKSPIMGT